MAWLDPHRTNGERRPRRMPFRWLLGHEQYSDIDFETPVDQRFPQVFGLLEVGFSDMMFDTDDLYAVYSDVGDDSEADFQSKSPNNAGVGTSYEWEMTAEFVDQCVGRFVFHQTLYSPM